MQVQMGCINQITQLSLGVDLTNLLTFVCDVFDYSLVVVALRSLVGVGQAACPTLLLYLITIFSIKFKSKLCIGLGIDVALCLSLIL